MNIKNKIHSKELKKLYWKDKLSVSKIAERFGLSYATIWKKMDKYEIKRRNLSEANTLNNLSRKIFIPKNTMVNLYIRRKLPSTKIDKLFNCHHSVILRRMKEFGIRSRNLSEAMTKYPKKDFNGNILEKSYLIGFRYGDLYVAKVNPKGQIIKIECSTTSPEQIFLVDKLFANYGHKYEFKFKGFREETRVCYYLNKTFDFLLEKSKKISRKILNNHNNFFAFLAGYVDAEGSIGVYSRGGLKQASFILSTCDKAILKQIYDKLISKNIQCGTLRIVSPKGYVTPKKPRPYTKDYWGFGVYSKKSLIRLFRNINPYVQHPKIIRNISNATKNIIWRNREFGNLKIN